MNEHATFYIMIHGKTISIQLKVIQIYECQRFVLTDEDKFYPFNHSDN